MAKKDDAKSRAAAAGLNADGIDTSPPDHSDLQERVDTMEAQGYFGSTPDPTPNENYSLKTPQGTPTPETDADLFAEARLASHGTARTAIDRSAVEVARGDGEEQATAKGTKSMEENIKERASS